MGNTIFWPFAKPVEEAPLSTFDTFHFVAKSVLGVGTFFMPFAYVYAGSIGGILCTTLFTFLYIYGIHLMLQCMNEARDRNKSDDMTMSETVAFACDQGCVMFSLSSVGVMVTIESKMTKPEAYLGWWGTLNRAACFVFITNLIWGLYAYLRLGDLMYMPFLENSPMVSEGELGKMCAAILVALTYPLNGFVAINIIFNQYIAKNRSLEHPVRVEIIVRVIFLLLTAIPALAFPSVFPAVQLVCAVALPLLNLIIPACTKLSLGYDSDKKWIWILLHILMIILGIGVLLCGLYSAYYDITILYLKKPMEKPFWDSAYDELLS
ncbi:hypothetical protein ACLKA7_010187 [Drosophila subpalustris]